MTYEITLKNTTERMNIPQTGTSTGNSLFGLIQTTCGVIIAFMLPKFWAAWTTWRKENKEREEAKKASALELQTTIGRLVDSSQEHTKVLKSISDRFSLVDERFSNMEVKVDNIQKDVTGINEKVHHLSRRVDKLEKGE